MLGKAECKHFPRSGCKPIPHLPGETRGVPWVAEGIPGSRGAARGGAEFCLTNTRVGSGRCPAKARLEQSGAARVGGRERREGVEMGFPPLWDQQ